MDPHSNPPCCRVSLAEICSLYQKLFQTPADMRSVQAAVDKIYWDFQLLDFNRDSSLSLSDIKILLQKARESQVTSKSWVDFLTQRHETSNRVTWSELEAWFFETSSPLGASPQPSNAQISFNENDQLQYQGELMNESKRLKNQWDAGGLEVIVRAAEDTTNARGYLLITEMDLCEAVDQKFAALNEKLFCDMLQAHYGTQVWASMNNGQKEQNMSELKMLAEFGLERGSELILSQLPGAAHNFRDEESSCSCGEVKKTWKAVNGLKELQKRLELEKNNLTSYNEEQSNSICLAYHYLLLFAQKIKVKMECNFSAALLVVEPYWKERFWDEKPVCLETCFEELAHIRLTTGQRMKQNSEEEKLGFKKLSVEEGKLLSLLKRQEEARDLLFQLLHSCSHEELQEPSSSLLPITSEENMGTVKEVSKTKVERNPLRQLFLLAMTVTKTCLLDDHEMVTWGDCAVRLLVQVQLKQELELREVIMELSRGVYNDDHSGQQTKEPVLEGNDPVSYLIHLLQPITPKEQLNLEQFKAELVSSLECNKLHEELDNKNIKDSAFDNQGIMVSTSTQEENKTSPNDNNATIGDQDSLKNNDLHIKRPKECSFREKTQEKIQRRQTLMVSSMLKEHEKEQGQQWESSRKERNLLIETIHKGSGRGISQVETSMQNEKCEQTKHKHVEQVPSDELALSVMEATESLIAGLMTLKEKVEEVYMKRADRHSPPRPAGSDTEALSVMPKKGMNIQTEPKTMKKPPLKNTGKCLIPNNTDTSKIACCVDGEPLNKEDVAKTGILDQRSISCEKGKERQEGEFCGRQKKQKRQKTNFFYMKDQLQLSSDERMDRNKTPGGEMKCNIPAYSVQTSPENLSSSVLGAAEGLIISLKALKEEISHYAKSQLIEHSGEPIMGKDSMQQKITEVASRTDCESKPSFSSVKKNVENLDDSNNDDRSLGIQSDPVPGPVTREISWELHPQCSRGCSHAKLWDSEVRSEHCLGEGMAGIDCSAVSGNTSSSSEDKRESLNCGLKCLDEKTKTSLPEPLAQREEQAADTEYMSYASEEKKQTDCYQEGDQKVPLTEEVESGGTLKEGREDIAVSTLDSSSEDSATEQGSADMLAMSFLEAAHNLIGELIPGKEEAGLSSVRRVVVILTDSENGDLILGQGEEVSEVSGTISTLEESSSGESQVILLKDEEKTDDHRDVPMCSSKEIYADCVLSITHANLMEYGPEEEASTKLKEVNRQLPIPDTEDVKRMTCHSQGCDGIGKSQCRKRTENEKENPINKLTSEKPISSCDFGTIKEANPHISSKVETVTVDNPLPTDKEMEANNIHDMEAAMDNEEQRNKNEDTKGDDNNTLNPGEKSESGSNTVNVTISERGDPLTQAEAGLDGTVMTDSGVESHTEKHYKESGKDEVGATTDENFIKSKSVHSGDLKQMNDEEYLSTGQNYISNENKDDETDDSTKLSQSYLCLSQESPGTLVNSVLLSTQNLIGSLTSLKESLGKNDKIIRSMKTEDNNPSSAEDHTNEQKKSNANAESCSQFCDALSCKSSMESIPNMLLKLSYVSANSEDTAEQQEEDPSVISDNMDHNAPLDNKEGPIIGDGSNKTVVQEYGKDTLTDDRNESMVENETGLKDDKGQSDRALSLSQKYKLPDCNDGGGSPLDFQKNKVSDVEEPSGYQAGHGGSCQEKERLSLSTGGKKEAEGMVLVNQGHRDWKKKWKSMYERQMDKPQKCDDDSKLESSISKRIKIQIIEKSKSDSACYKQRLRPPSPTTTVLPEFEMQEKANETSSRPENMETGEHMNVIEGTEGDPVTENQIIGTEQTDTAKTMSGNSNEQGSIKDLTISLLEATNSLIGRISSFKGELGRSQGTDSFVSCKEIEQNVQDIKEQTFNVETTDLAPVSLMMETGDINRTSDIKKNENRTIMGNSTKKDECYQAMNDESMNNHQIQETSANEKCRGGIQRHQARCEEKLASNQVVFSITSNLAIIQKNLNQGEHCQMRKDTQLEISAHSVGTSHQIGNTETTQIQFKNKTQILQEEMGPTAQLIKQHLTDTPLPSESIIGTEQTMPKETLSNTSYCLKVSHMQVSSEHNICEMNKIKLGPVQSEPEASGNSNEEINADQLRQTDNPLNEERHQKPDNKKVEQTSGPEIKDFEEIQTLRSYIRNGVIKRKMEDAQEREEEKHNKENKKESNKNNYDQPNRHWATTSSDMYQGIGSESTDLHQLKQGPCLKFWEADNQTVTVAAVTTTQSSNFFSHMNQVPANGVLVRNEKQLSCPPNTSDDAQVKTSTLLNILETGHGTKKQDCAVSSCIPQICSLPHGQAILQREKVFIHLSLREQQEAMQRLTDLQREAELKCASDRRRQMLRFQERLSIARNRKSELDFMDITKRISPQLSPEPLPEGDAEQQKSAVKEHLEKVKRERTYIMQTRRDRNMTSFRELLDPVLTGKKREDSGSELKGGEGL